MCIKIDSFDILYILLYYNNTDDIDFICEGKKIFEDGKKSALFTNSTVNFYDYTYYNDDKQLLLIIIIIITTMQFCK